MNFFTRNVICVFCIVLSSCKNQDSSVEWEILGNETKIVELSQKIRLLQMRVEKETSAAREFDAANASALDLTAQAANARTRQSEMIVAIAALEHDFAAAEKESAQQARLSARGRTFATFRDNKRSYSDVTITEVTDIGIQISHKDGRSRITCDDLTESQIQEFGLNSELARATLHHEQKQIAAYDAAQDQAELAQRQQKQKDAIAALYVQTPSVALSSKQKTAYFKSTQPKTVYRVRRSSSYYTRPTYYYSNYYSPPTHCQTPMLYQQRTSPRTTTPFTFYP